MISEHLYQNYLNLLLNGKRFDCGSIVQDLLDRDIEIKTLYTDLFQKSLYEIGELWENNRITVAREHLVTAITEGLLNLAYPSLFKREVYSKSKSAVISCGANEFHQIGGKMVADMFELNGWNGYFLGANTPVEDLVKHIHEVKPDLVGLSISISSNMPLLRVAIESIRSNFKDLDIFVGGRAFDQGEKDMVKDYSGVCYIQGLDELNRIISQ